MKTPILYSFVRFRPYIETGEFVNVGLIMCQPQQRKLTYRLVRKDDKRVNDFFYKSKIFINIREIIDEELRQITQHEFNFTPQEMAQFFHNYIDLKEGTVQYSNPTVILVDNPLEYFDKIYTDYINKAGVSVTSQENIMIKTYKEMFKNHHIEILSEYKQHLVQGDTAKFTLPLALTDGTGSILKGIKPLAFDQTETASMIEHCDAWVAKINRATDERLISKKDILFTLDSADTKSKANILDAIKRTFDRFQIQHIDWKENKHILDFATDVKTF